MLAEIKLLGRGHRGLTVATTIALCAAFLSEHYSAPVMLFALLIGMGFHFLAEDEQCKSGLDFASKTLLRLGVALLGFRLSFSDVAGQGWEPIALIIALVAMTILSGLVLAPLFKRTTQFGLLTGGAVAICGASAALAISAAMPKNKNLEQNTLFTVIAVTALSTIAMVLYPLLFALLGFNDAEVGFLIGVTIHDVAQVVGAGYSVSDTAGDVATLTKLQRVLLLPVAILCITIGYCNKAEGRIRVPFFVIMFGVFVAVNSLGIMPAPLVEIMVEASRWLLIIAIAALGVKTSLKAMFNLGSRHIVLVCMQTVLLLGAAIILVRFINI